jgi:hypothetical protein
MNTLDSWAAFASTKINIAAFLAAIRWAIYKTPRSWQQSAGRSIKRRIPMELHRPELPIPFCV